MAFSVRVLPGFVAALCFAGTTDAAEQAVFQAHGFFAARASVTEAQASWLDGGFGRLSAGRGTQPETVAQGGTEARLRLQMEYGLEWTLNAHLGARYDSNTRGRNLGLVEATLQRRWFVGSDQRWQLTLGQFFLPSSRENTDLLWVSPYTLTNSALNSWIGEEFRPVGADLSWRRSLDNGNQLELAGTVFGNNDSSGALLAWRGFAWHDRLSYFGETLPLPALFSLADEELFAVQNSAGSKPFGPDLDGRPGYAARVRWSNAQQRYSLAVVDNQGDRWLHRGEYAWRTRFLVAGFDHNAGNPGWSLLGELLHGRSDMGPKGLPRSDVRFSSAYLMASHGGETWRRSLRVESFHSRDMDRSIAENNNENGWALTFAMLRYVGSWRLGFEALHVDGKRPAAADEGAALQAGGTQLRVEARYEF